VAGFGDGASLRITVMPWDSSKLAFERALKPVLEISHFDGDRNAVGNLEHVIAGPQLAWPVVCSAIAEATMPKHDHHKAAQHHEEAAKSHRKAAEAHEKGEHADASQHSQIANDHSAKAHEASNSAHEKTKGPKKL
jgi:hypothetical protein